MALFPKKPDIAQESTYIAPSFGLAAFHETFSSRDRRFDSCAFLCRCCLVDCSDEKLPNRGSAHGHFKSNIPFGKVSQSSLVRHAQNNRSHNIHPSHKGVLQAERTRESLKFAW